MTKREDDKKADDVRKASQKEFDQQAKALEGRTNATLQGGQTGPAQGQDPAVKLPTDETREDVVLVEQNNNTGPAQEPVHRVAEPTAPGDPAHELDDVSKNNDGSKTREHKEPKRSAKLAKLGDAEVDSLAQLIKRAHETLGVEHMTDGGGRHWTAQYGHVNNQAAITVQVAYGDDVAQTVLATSGMALDEDDHLHKAVNALVEQLK